MVLQSGTGCAHTDLEYYMAWTPITAGLDWQNLAFLNELVTGYNERRRGAIILSKIADVVAGDDIQSYTFWKSIQTGIEGCLNDLAPAYTGYGYLDDTVTVAGSDALVALTKAQLFSRASMHASGWRRATSWDPAVNDWTDINDPMFSYGKMQAGDIIGPWIFLEIQNTLSQLKWTAWEPGPDMSNYPDSRLKNITAHEDDCAASLAKINTDWGGAWSAGSMQLYGVSRRCSGGDSLKVKRSCSKMKMGLSDTDYGPPLVSFNWELYAMVGPDYDFTDLDGLGLIDGKYYLDQSSSSPSATWEFTTPIRGGGDKTTNPAGLAPAWSCPIGDEEIGVFTFDAFFVLKHVFTNS